MAPQSSKPLFPNPFYLLLIIASVIFTVTVLAYLVGPSIQQRALDHPGAGAGAGARPGRGSLAMVAWLDRNGPLALGVEFAVMLVSGVLAMATDRWFPERPGRPSPPPG